MKLDNLENMTEEQILELYDDTMLISSCENYWYVECDRNGYRGYCQSCGYNCSKDTASGYTYYDNNRNTYWNPWFCCEREGGGRFYRLPGGRDRFVKCNPLSRYR